MMSSACPLGGALPCLLPMFGRKREEEPAKAPRGMASEEECRMEQELVRLRTEQRRLLSVNEALKKDMNFKRSMPAQSVGKMKDLFAFIPQTYAEHYEDEDKAADGQEETSPLSGEASPQSPTTLKSKLEDSFRGLAAKGSALSMTRPARAVIFTVAFGFLVFVMLAYTFHLGAHHVDPCAHGGHHRRLSGGHSAVSCPSHGSLESHGSHHGSHHVSHHGSHADSDAGSHDDDGYRGHDEDVHTDTHGAHHRRLGGAVSPLMKNIGFTMTACGVAALLMQRLKMPLLLGYLLGGIIVGPMCLSIVESAADIKELSSLGLVFLMFMTGLELDMKNLFRMGKDSLVTGIVQFPISASIAFGLLSACQAVGLDLGESGIASTVYCAVGVGLSSPLIVTKVLGMKGETDSVAGRMTMGILIIQDMWTIVLLLLQANLSNFSLGRLLSSFCFLALLIIVTLGYAKFVMPAVLGLAAKSAELMLVLSLAWCFFVTCIAMIPFVGLPMELAALIAGTALGTFPYSTEFNAKIRYIRDFFLCLFFAGMGMMLPLPTFSTIALSIVIAMVVLLSRILSIFLPIQLLSKNTRVGVVATVNLAQLGEFALVLCTLGVSHNHVGTHTLETILLAFVMTTILSPILLRNSHHIYQRVRGSLKSGRAGRETKELAAAHDEESRDIVLLGFHKVAFMLIAEFQARSPELLSKFHVIDFNKKVLHKLEERGLGVTSGDISSVEVLRKAIKDGARHPRLVVCTIPDSLLQGTSNDDLIRNVKEVWPDAHVIVTADSPLHAGQLYDSGADYVLRMAKLSAERLQEMLSDNVQDTAHGGLAELFSMYKERDDSIKAEWLDQAKKW